MTPAVSATAWTLGWGATFADAAPSADACTMPLATFVTLAEAAARRAASPILGWLVGERHNLESMDQIGPAVMSSSTLGLALRCLANYFALVQDATEFDLRQDGDHCIVSYRILDPDIWPREQDALFTLALVGQLIAMAEGASWFDVELMIESENPAVSLEIARHTGASCFGGNDANSLRFPRRLLDQPLRCARVPTARVAAGSLSRSLAKKRRDTSVAVRVQTAIYQHLGSRMIRQEEVAAELGMSSRTLRRRLSDEKLSFQHIVDECRLRQAAHEFRRRGRVSLAQTALRLGYSEHSTFTRAFSRWSGVSPQRYIRAGLAQQVGAAEPRS